jgi:peptidyl-prolyl cis-trans isomerase A (cyclophilin A)
MVSRLLPLVLLFISSNVIQAQPLPASEASADSRTSWNHDVGSKQFLKRRREMTPESTRSIQSGPGYDKTSCDSGYHAGRNFGPVAPDPRSPPSFIFGWNTTIGNGGLIVIKVVRAWSPHGVDRMFQLILDNYFNCATFFRVVPGFVVQLGLAADPALTAKWNSNIPDDVEEDSQISMKKQSNKAGTISFAKTSDPNSRSTQIFINTVDNTSLDHQGFTPIGHVLAGLDLLSTVYNPTPEDNMGISQDELTTGGNTWVLSEYPQIDMITRTVWEQDELQPWLSSQA